MGMAIITGPAPTVALRCARKDLELDLPYAGLRERSAVLTLINETLSRTVAPVKQFLGLLV
jgi:hypothetical protein